MRALNKKDELILDKLDFENWLMVDCGFSKKSAKDCYCRCKRVEKLIAIDLAREVRSEVSFNELVLKIKSYSKSNGCSDKSGWALSATLKYSVKKYALFKNENKYSGICSPKII